MVGMRQAIHDFLKLESSGGIILVATAILAIILANSPLAWAYQLFIDTPVEVRVGPLEIAKPLLLWINDGLMAIFFFLIGLELKREVLEGELNNLRKMSLPFLGAVGGMVVPAAVYAYINWGDVEAMKGWAIPTATDIAFALGVLTLFGTRAPTSLKLFLVSLAIFDDVGAIVIIAVFYTVNLSLLSLSVASACLVVLFIMNRRGVMTLSPYIFIGLIMWTAVLKSGVHATLAGIALAQFIPMRDPNNLAYSPLRELEHDLHYLVAFLVLPVFAFANAGVPIANASLDYIFHPIPLGIAAGLFIGKQLGVFAFTWVGVKLGFSELSEGINWPMLYGVALLSGIGFTMSLFIGTLAFDAPGTEAVYDERLGTLMGSLASGVLGFIVLHFSLPKAKGKDSD